MFKTEEYNGVDTEKFVAHSLIPKSDTKTVASVEQAYQVVFRRKSTVKVKSLKVSKPGLLMVMTKSIKVIKTIIPSKRQQRKRPTLSTATKPRLSKKMVFCMVVAMSTFRLTFGSWTILTARKSWPVLTRFNCKKMEVVGTKSEGADCFESLDDDDDF